MSDSPTQGLVDGVKAERHTDKKCAFCGEVFRGLVRAKTCSPACRTARGRRRRKWRKSRGLS